jgi:hypothetical protein
MPHNPLAKNLMCHTKKALKVTGRVQIGEFVHLGEMLSSYHTNLCYCSFFCPMGISWFSYILVNSMFEVFHFSVHADLNYENA